MKTKYANQVDIGISVNDVVLSFVIAINVTPEGAQSNTASLTPVAQIAIPLGVFKALSVSLPVIVGEFERRFGTIPSLAMEAEQTKLAEQVQ